MAFVHLGLRVPSQIFLQIRFLFYKRRLQLPIPSIKTKAKFKYTGIISMNACQIVSQTRWKTWTQTFRFHSSSLLVMTFEILSYTESKKKETQHKSTFIRETIDGMSG